MNRFTTRDLTLLYLICRAIKPMDVFDRFEKDLSQNGRLVAKRYIDRKKSYKWVHRAVENLEIVSNQPLSRRRGNLNKFIK